MNYPFRNAILDFMRGRDSGQGLKNVVMSIVENYPPQVVACNMNLLGTHDTPGFSPPWWTILTAAGRKRPTGACPETSWRWPGTG